MNSERNCGNTWEIEIENKDSQEEWDVFLKNNEALLKLQQDEPDLFELAKEYFDVRYRMYLLETVENDEEASDDLYDKFSEYYDNCFSDEDYDKMRTVLLNITSRFSLKP